MKSEPTESMATASALHTRRPTLQRLYDERPAIVIVLAAVSWGRGCSAAQTGLQRLYFLIITYWLSACRAGAPSMCYMDGYKND